MLNNNCGGLMMGANSHNHIGGMTMLGAGAGCQEIGSFSLSIIFGRQLAGIVIVIVIKPHAYAPRVVASHFISPLKSRFVSTSLAPSPSHQESSAFVRCAPAF